MRIALIAHDNCKMDMVEWVSHNFEVLVHQNLFCTGTTGKLVREALARRVKEEGLENADPRVTCLKSGPLGGDQQIGAMIADEELDVVIFFTDSLTAQPHDTDIKSLQRLASMYNIPMAGNRATADYIITSPLFDNPSYKRFRPNFDRYNNRKL